MKTGNINRDMPTPDGQVVPLNVAVIGLDFHLVNGAGEFTLAVPLTIGQSLYELLGKALKKKPGLIVPQGVNGDELR